MLSFNEMPSSKKGRPVKNNIEWFPFPFPPPLTAEMFFFFDGSAPDITGSSRVSLAQPQKAPADHSSRQGGVGHSRGRSYQGAAECEGQKSWCIQAHHTVTRHSSAQGPSEQASTHFKQAPHEQSSSASVLRKVCTFMTKEKRKKKGNNFCF